MNADNKPLTFPARRQVFLLLGIVLLAFGLRMYRASTTLMWGDEGFSVYSASRDLYAITFEGKDVDPHPPLYYYLFHFWLPPAGASELAIRFFSIFFGTATVALVYTLGKKLFDERTGLLAAAFLTIAPFAVHYSQEVRMYSLVMFLGALTMYVFVKWLQAENSAQTSALSRGRTERNRLSVAFFLSMFLTQYSLYQSAYLFVAQGIFLLPFLRTRFRFVVKWLGVSALIVLLFLPWLVAHSSSAFVDIKDVAGQNARPMGAFDFLARGFAAIAIGPTIPFTTALVLSELVLAIILLGLAMALSQRVATRNDWLLATFVVVPMLSLYPIYFLAPLYRGRLFALALTPLMLALARSVALIVRRAKRSATVFAIGASVPIALILLGTSFYSLNNYFYNYSRYNPSVDDYIPAISSVEERSQSGDIVLFHAYWQIGYFESHYRGAPIEYRLLDNQRDVNYAAAKPRNVWAIVQGLPIHGGEVWLDKNAYLVDEVDYGQMRVLSYRAGEPARTETFSPPLVFDNGISLVGYRLNDSAIDSGRGTATIELDWQPNQRIGDDYTVSVRLTDLRGQTIFAQVDSQPVNGITPTTAWEPGEMVADRHGLAIPYDIPPGEYAVQIVLYSFIDNRVASITAPENYRGTSVLLGKVTIVRPPDTTRK